MTYQLKVRDETADIAKGIGIMFVVAGHCEFELKDFFSSSFHMPLFFFIAGFFIASFINDPSQKASQFLKHRFLRLMAPFFVYNLIFGLVSWASQFTGLRITTGSFASVLSLHNLFIEPFLSNHQFLLSCPLWFVPALYCAFIFIALLRPILSYCTRHPRWLPLLFGCLVCLYYCCAFANDVTPYNFRFLARDIIGCIYVILGYFYYISPLPRVDCRLMLLAGLGVFYAISFKLGHITYSMVGNQFSTATTAYASLPSALAAIIIVLSLSRLVAGPQSFINKNGFIYFGRVTYEIMAIHLSFFVLLNCALCILLNRPFSLLTTPYYFFSNCAPLYLIAGLCGSYWYARALGKIRKGVLGKLISYWETDPGGGKKIKSRASTAGAEKATK